MIIVSLLSPQYGGNEKRIPRSISFSLVCVCSGTRGSGWVKEMNVREKCVDIELCIDVELLLSLSLRVCVCLRVCLLINVAEVCVHGISK